MNSIEELRIVQDDDMRGMSAVAWAEAHQEEIRSLLEAEGAVLIRGLKVLGSTQFGKILSTLFGADLLEYVYRSTPRTELGGHVYTATEYSASETIPQHNENAYSRNWPLRLGFMCLLPSETGGETPIGDSRVVYRMLPESVREKVEEKGVKYVRNYSTLELSTLDLPWSVVFQTEDKSQVEAYCEANALDYEWLEDDALRTSQVNPATAVHPQTGEKVWFNQAHLFHVSSVDEEVAQTLLDS